MNIVARIALKPGMILAEPVYHNGELLYEEGFVLDADSIEYLGKILVMAVAVKEPAVLAKNHFERVRCSEGFIKFDENYRKYFPAYKSILYNFIEKEIPFDINNLLKIYNLITASVPDPKTRLDYLANRLPSEDEITYEHCLNCAIICGVFGNWWHLSQDQLTILILCGFFFDIGKLKLPEKLLWKTQKLSNFEYNWIKTHTTLGYNLLKNERLNPHILEATLSHHERGNGSGYPKHLLADQIDPYAKMMAIVDSYDAMTCSRCYRASFPVLDVIANFEKTGFSVYGNEYIIPIVQKLSLTQIGMKVLLSDHSTATITGISPSSYGKAIVTREDGTRIDLAVVPSLKIVEYL